MLQFALAFVVFVSSACGMVMEIVAGRAYLFGDGLGGANWFQSKYIKKNQPKRPTEHDVLGNTLIKNIRNTLDIL